MFACLKPFATKQRRAARPSHGRLRKVFKLNLESLEVRLAPSATYYVSPTGSNTRNGLTPQTAWRSISRVNAQPLASGDTILFKGGATFRGSLQIYDVAGLTISSYGTGRATIASGAADGIWYAGPGGLSIHDLNFTGPGADFNDTVGINITGFSTPTVGIRIDKVDVTGYGLLGLVIQPAEVPFRDITVTHSRFLRNANGALIGNGDPHNRLISNLYVADNEFALNARSTPNVMAGLGLDVLGVSGGVIERNLSHDNGANSPSAGHNGLMVEYSDNVVIQHNEAYHNLDTGWGDGQGIVANGLVDSFVQYNYTHDNDNAGIEIIGEYAPSSNLTVRFNVSENDGVGIVLGWVEVWDLKVYNNTVFVSQADGRFRAAVTVMSWSGSASFWNNIFQAEQGAVHVQVTPDSLGGHLQFQGNVYASDNRDLPLFIIMGDQGVYTLDDWRNAWGQELAGGVPVGSDADPGLVAPGHGGTIGDPARLATLNAYHLLGSSPVLHTGLDLWGLLGIDPGLVDYFGNPVVRGTSSAIGAYVLG